MIVLKDEPELRHVLAHLMEAIHMASLGDVKTTQYELDSIEGLVLFDGEDDFRRYVNGMSGQEERKDQKTQTNETEKVMAKVKGRAKPGISVTRKVSRGPNKGDTVQFRANKASAAQPGKLKPRRLIKDVGPKNRTTLLKGKKKK